MEFDNSRGVSFDPGKASVNVAAFPLPDSIRRSLGFISS